MTSDSRAPEFDLDWGDEEVVTGIHYPDTYFLFARMTEATHAMVAPQAGELILDVGCGKAVDATQLAGSGGQVVALDPSGRMLRQARNELRDCDREVMLVRGIGEALPFKRHSLDKVVCKGALDHFPNPEKSVAEMSSVLKPQGEAVIAIANFESLSCRVGRALHAVARQFARGNHPRTPWELPSDHTFKFDYPLLVQMMERHFRVKRVLPVSLLWTAPYWGRIISIPPKRVAKRVLSFLDVLARTVPWLSDVIIIKGTPKHA